MDAAKAVIVILEGIVPGQVPGFGDRTVLQVAHTPVLDAVAAAGLSGWLPASHHLTAQSLLAPETTCPQTGPGSGTTSAHAMGSDVKVCAVTVAADRPGDSRSWGCDTLSLSAQSNPHDLAEYASLVSAAVSTPAPIGTEPQSAAAAASNAHGGYDMCLLHTCASESSSPNWQVLVVQAVDKMLGQLIQQLWQQQQASQAQYCLAVTVLPPAPPPPPPPPTEVPHTHTAPMAMAHITHIVEALGADYVTQLPLTPVLWPSDTPLPSDAQLNTQGMQCETRHKAAEAGRPWFPFMPAEVFGPWKDPWPQVVQGDSVIGFDETQCAKGGLGQVPTPQFLPLVKHWAGWSAAAEFTHIAFGPPCDMPMRSGSGRSTRQPLLRSQR